MSVSSEGFTLTLGRRETNLGGFQGVREQCRSIPWDPGRRDHGENGA